MDIDGNGLKPGSWNEWGYMDIEINEYYNEKM